MGCFKTSVWDKTWLIKRHLQLGVNICWLMEKILSWGLFLLNNGSKVNKLKYIGCYSISQRQTDVSVDVNVSSNKGKLEMKKEMNLSQDWHKINEKPCWLALGSS